MIFLQHLIAFLIIFFCVYTLIDRICKCIEYCAGIKTYSDQQEGKKNE